MQCFKCGITFGSDETNISTDSNTNPVHKKCPNSEEVAIGICKILPTIRIKLISEWIKEAGKEAIDNVIKCESYALVELSTEEDKIKDIHTYDNKSLMKSHVADLIYGEANEIFGVEKFLNMNGVVPVQEGPWFNISENSELGYVFKLYKDGKELSISPKLTITIDIEEKDKLNLDVEFNLDEEN